MAGVAFCYGGFLALMGPVTADDFGPTYLGVNFGIMFFTVAISSFVGPRIAAVVADANGGSFSNAFLIAAAISVLGLVLVGAHALLRTTLAVRCVIIAADDGWTIHRGVMCAR